MHHHHNIETIYIGGGPLTYLKSGVTEKDQLPNSLMVSGFNMYAIPHIKNTAAACTYRDFSQDEGEDNIEAAKVVLPLFLK